MVRSRVRSWFRKWVYARSGLIDTGLKSGYYYSYDVKILHGMFSELVDLVEVELAREELVFQLNTQINTWAFRNAEKRPGLLGNALRAVVLKIYVLKRAWIRYRARDAAAGINYLKSTANTDLAGDPQKYHETLILYTWWKTVRPARPDPMAEYLAVGLAATNQELRDLYEKGLIIEDNYEREDREMQIRLINLKFWRD